MHDSNYEKGKLLDTWEMGMRLVAETACLAVM